MKAELTVRRFHQRPLFPPENSETLVHFFRTTSLEGEVEIIPIVPSLGGEQRLVKILQLGIQEGCHSGKTFSGAGLDKGADNQGIQQFRRFMGAHLAAQSRRVAGGTDRTILDTALLHDGNHLLEMAHFLPGQP